MAESTDTDGMTRISQNVTWSVSSRHRNIQYYIIKYKLEGEGANITTKHTDNNATQATLKLPGPRKETPFNLTMQITAVSKAGQGEFSNRTQFSYSSKTEPLLQLLHMWRVIA